MCINIFNNGTITAIDIGSSQVIKEINGIRDSVSFDAGSNVSITPSGNTITISSSGGKGGEDITSVTAGNGLTGGGTSDDVTLSVDSDGITNDMLQANSVMTQEILDGTITTLNLADNSITTSKILNGTITASDIGNDITIKTGSNDGGLVILYWKLIQRIHFIVEEI